jgi:hypothetical protein
VVKNFDRKRAEKRGVQVPGFETFIRLTNGEELPRQKKIKHRRK